MRLVKPDRIGTLQPNRVVSDSGFMGGIRLMTKFNILPALIVASAIGIAATPVHAMKEPPSEPPTSSSSGGTPVPEPSSIILFGAGAAAFMFGNRRKKLR